MTLAKIILSAAIFFSMASCSTKVEQEITEREFSNDSVTSEIKPVDYISPISTGQSSAGSMKRERKFYIR